MVGQGGHRGGGHHSHSSSFSSSSSSGRSGVTYNNYYGGGGYYGGGWGWGGGPTFVSTYNQPQYSATTTTTTYGERPSQASSSCMCGCFLVVAVAFLSLLIVSNYSSPTHFTLDASETRLWAFGSPGFTSTLRIIDYSKDSKVDKYFIEAAPKLESTPGTTTPPQTHTETVTLDGGDWVHFAYYLNRNSIIAATFKVTSGSAHLYVIKSKLEFDRWADDPDEKKDAPVLSKYSSNSQPSSAVYTVSADDDYYVVFDNDKDYASATLEIAFTVSAAQYIITRADVKPVCAAQQQVCDVAVADSDLRKYILFAAPAANATTDPDATFEMDVWNEPRWSGIAFFWVFLPSLAVVACYIIPSAVALCKARSSGVGLGAGAGAAGAGAGAGYIGLVTPSSSADAPQSIELLSQTGYLVVAEAEPDTEGGAAPWAEVLHPGSGAGAGAGAGGKGELTESAPLLSQPGPLPSAPPTAKQ